CDDDPEQDADHAAKDRKHDRLHHELAHHIALLRPDCQPDADLPGPFRHRYEHDVHDADAPDDEGDARNAAQKQRQGLTHSGRARDDVDVVADRKIVGLPCLQAMTLAHDLLDV